MKRTLLTALLFAVIAASPAAQADGSIAFCQSGPVVAACPDGVQSNLSVSTGSNQGTASVAFAQTSGNSIASGQAGSNSVTGSTSNNSQSVGYNTSQSVGFRNSTSSVSVTGGSGGSTSVTGAH
jgi:hypothetical protein